MKKGCTPADWRAELDRRVAQLLAAKRRRESAGEEVERLESLVAEVHEGWLEALAEEAAARMEIS